jgi:hypothetical protein
LTTIKKARCIFGSLPNLVSLIECLRTLIFFGFKHTTNVDSSFYFLCFY